MALVVAVLWTISSLASEYASKRFGSLLLNIVRMAQTVVMIGLLLWICTGRPYPTHTNGDVWLFLALSSIVGYIIGDYYFLKCFIMIGARWGELFMTIAPPVAALTGWIFLGEQMSWMALVGMCVTMVGISMSVLARKEDNPKKIGVKLPMRGIVYGLIAGAGQGFGLVLSKQGMLAYEQHMQAAQVVAENPMIMPFAATMIRCIVALIGFSIMYGVARQMGKESHTLHLLVEDRKAISLATLSTITGPCVGVALSLMATLFTSTGIAQTIMALVPVLILWPSHLFFHTKITPMETIGAIISVAGVALFFV